MGQHFTTPALCKRRYAGLQHATLPDGYATGNPYTTLERNVILRDLLRSFYGLCSLPPWFRCLLFAKLDQMHPMRHDLGAVLLFAILAFPRPGLKLALQCDKLTLSNLARSLGCLPKDHDAMPLGLFLVIPFAVLIALARRDAQVSDKLT